MKLSKVTTNEGDVYFINSKTGERVEVDPRYTKNKSTDDKATNVKDGFNTLSSVGKFISIVGWVFVIASIFSLILILAEFEKYGILYLIVGIMGSINGVLVIAAGEAISCFVSIEKNTRETNNILKAINLNKNI